MEGCRPGCGLWRESSFLPRGCDYLGTLGWAELIHNEVRILLSSTHDKHELNACYPMLAGVPSKVRGTGYVGR